MAFANALTEALDRAGVAYELLEHERTERAADEAAALGLRPDEVAKTIVVSAGPATVRVVLPAADRLDLHKLRDVLDPGTELRLLTEDELGGRYPEFELGAVPPLGGPPDRVVVDRHVAERDHAVLEAGTHDRSVRLAASDLVTVAGAQVADVRAD